MRLDPLFQVARRIQSLNRREVNSLGKNLVLVGLIVAAIGAVLWVTGRATGGGFLPGDIVVERPHGRFYFPIVTCLLVSAALSLISWWVRR